MKKKAIFWDNDGILVDSEELYFEATRDTLAAVGIEIDRDYFIRVSLQEGRSVTEQAALGRLSREKIEALRQDRHVRYSRLIKDKLTPKPGVQECLQSLHGKAVMGVVTASLRDHFELIHGITGLLPFFDFYLTHEDVPKSKPSPEPYLAALKRVSLPPENCIVVEDSERGFASARAAGLNCLVVPSELTKGGRFDGALQIISSLDHLERELLKWLNH